MRDILLKSLSIDDISIIDIDIVDGEPVYLDYESQTGDQRAALSVYASKATVPGMLDYGVSWASIYDKEQNTVMQLNNELQQQVQNYAGAAAGNNELASTQYAANLLMSEEGIGVIVRRGGL